MPSLRSCLVCSLLAIGIAATAFGQAKLEPPVPVRMVKPDVPDNLRGSGAMGVVVIKCTIDEQGNVVGPEVEKSTNPDLDKSAVEAVKKWKFKPAKLDGNPVAKKVSIPIKFVAES